MHWEIEKLKKEQCKLHRKIVIKDDFEKADLLGGCDFAQWDKKVACTIVVYDAKEKKVVETQTVIGDEPMPYIPAFLFYRYGPAAIEAYLKLKTRPDILFVNGHGLLHPQGIGLASHLGLVLDIPTLGVAHKLLCGEIREGFVYFGGEKKGATVQTRPFSNHVIVSPGHRISMKTAILLTKESCIEPHKLPEPLHIAHKLVTKLKKEILCPPIEGSLSL